MIQSNISTMFQLLYEWVGLQLVKLASKMYWNYLECIAIGILYNVRNQTLPDLIGKYASTLFT